MEQQRCGTHQLTIHSQKVMQLDQSLMKPRQLKEISSPTHFSKCAAGKCVKIRDAKKRLSIVKVHGSLICPSFFYYILFHTISILKP
jgi:hypothetical protein